ncbi:MAG TPA: AMP-binding protein [Candidatus Angelobacter sp.]|nr:AMP-binding protein [Candidatus Angelobacter sp.]
MRAIDYFDKGAEAFPDRIAIVDRDTQYSYRQAQEASRKIARALWSNGLRGEEPAAIFSINDARILLCMAGLMRAGAVWIPLNHRNALDANVQFLNYSKTSWLFYHSAFRAQVREIKALVPSLKHFVCLDTEIDGDPSLESFMKQGDQGEDPDWGDARGNLDRLAGLVPTGGTTGPAKGVMVTNLSWGTMVETANLCLRCDDIEPVCLSTAPLSHAAGVVAFAMFPMGATNVVMPAFDALEVLQNIPRYHVTHIFLPPTALYAMLAHPRVGEFDYSSLRRVLIAAAPVSPDKLKKAVEVFGPCVCQSFGQTEVPMYMTYLDTKTLAAAAADDHPERLRSCGKATPAVRLAIMDDQGNLLPPHKTGEIVARGALVSAGYYNLPEATAEIRTFGWHHTGDVGYRDEDGFFYIVDRKKDMIITGGFNVYCAEVEACVMELPQVRECAVIGVPDEKWGEAVKAIVVLRDGESLTEEALIAHCKERLGSVKSPKSAEFWKEIPKTPAAKTDKKAMRKPYWAKADRAVH